MQSRMYKWLILLGLLIFALFVFCCVGAAITSNVPISNHPTPKPIEVKVVSWKNYNQIVEDRQLFGVDVILTNTTSEPVESFYNTFYVRTDENELILVNFFASEMVGQAGRLGGKIMPGSQELHLGFFVPLGRGIVSFVYDDPRWDLVEMELK